MSTMSPRMMTEPLLKDLIKKRRIQLNMNQRDVARAMRLSSEDYIGMVESGIRRLDLERLPALARVLDLPLAEIADMSIRERYGKPETQWFVDQYCGDDLDLMKLLRQLDPESKAAMKSMAELLLAKKNPNELRRAG